jgi:hypothetical protein
LVATNLNTNLGDTVGQAVAFSWNGNTYVYIDGAGTGYQSASDAVVQLVGVTITDVTLATFVP